MVWERGLPVSAAARRTYLRRVRVDAADKKARRQTRRPRDASGDILGPSLCRCHAFTGAQARNTGGNRGSGRARGSGWSSGPYATRSGDVCAT
jgi:hypothetical protein